MTTDRHKKDNLQVQFRSGTAVGKRLARLARQWKVTTNEAARRLVILGLMGLTKDQYGVLTQLEEEAGDDDLTDICGQAMVALDVYDQMTSKPDCLPPKVEERIAFLTTWLARFVGAAEEEPVARRIRRNIAGTTEEAAAK